MQAYILEEIAQAADSAMDKVLSSTPNGFPERLATSIIRGATARLKMFGEAKRG